MLLDGQNAQHHPRPPSVDRRTLSARHQETISAESIISRVRLETRFRHFLHGMLQQPPDSITSSSSNNGVVVLDVGLVEEQFATLWWALAEQTARVARRAEQADPAAAAAGAIETRSGITSSSSSSPQLTWRNAAVGSVAMATSSATIITPDRGHREASVASRTFSRCSSSSSSSSSRSISSTNMSSSTMSSPRLVREICRKYPASTSYVGGLPVYQSYVYEAPSTDVVAGGNSNGGVQLLRYVRVSQQQDGQDQQQSNQQQHQRMGSFRRPKSEMVIPRKFDMATQQNRDLQLDTSAAVTPASGGALNNSAECVVRYGSQDLGRDVCDDMAIMAAPVEPARSPSDGRPASSLGYSPLAVVAIDFGTTYSGYAFSFIHDPEEIHMMRKWEGGDPGIPNTKTPTMLLLRPSGAFHSFGYSARDFYHDLPAREARQWLFFDKFKMALHHQKFIGRSTLITAANGESLPALSVFAHALRFFKELVLRQLSDQTAMTIHNEDIRWVITVPAIWRASAKQLMREAAYEAGLGSERIPQQVLISLEPEAASIFCRQLKRHHLKPDRPAEMHLVPLTAGGVKPAPLKPWASSGGTGRLQRDSIYSEPVMEALPGQRYIVVDCGGGTVDITVHQVMDLDGHHLKELHRATGGPFGSIGVDLAFEHLLDGIFGADFMNHFKARLPASYVDLMVAFEARKRHASPYRCTPFNIALPFSMIDCFRKYRGREVEFAIRKYADPHIRWSTQGMLRLDQEAMRNLFQPTIRAILEHIEDILTHPDLPGVDYLFLVGGFAESPLLQQAVRAHFGDGVTVVIPQDVSLAILKGAVLYGINPLTIKVRRSRLTYGVAVLNRFIHGRHPLDKRVVKDGIEYCKDIFDKFVVVDQSVSMGERIVRSYSPARRHQRRIVLNIYCAESEDVQFVTDPGVRLFATLSLDLGFSCAPKSRREIRVTMEFGDTEIRASAIDVFSGNSIKASFDFLDH